jgi:hypothetical protein
VPNSEAVHLVHVRVVDPRFANRQFVAREIEAKSHAHVAYVGRECAAVLAQDEWDARRIVTLARRENYQAAVNFLAEQTGRADRIVPALLFPPNSRIAPFRFSNVFNAADDHDESVAFTPETLRSIGTEAALCALAALGEMNWRDLKSARCRSVFALRELIAVRRL